MKSTIVIAVLLITSSALADFSGTWVGKWELTVEGMGTTMCDVSMTIQQTATRFDILDYHTLCESGDERKKAPDYTIFDIESGSVLMRKGKRVGTIGEYHLESAEDFGQSGLLTIRLKIKNGEMEYYRTLEGIRTPLKAIGTLKLRQ